MGALLAYEAAVRLEEVGRRPSHLIVSGRPAPDRSSDEPPIHLLSDADFAMRLRRYNGAAQEIWENSELLAVVLPTIRADFRACETYTYRPRPPLRCPITALAGREDPDATRAALEAWRRHTRSEFHAEILDGDHFFLEQNRAAALAAIKVTLTHDRVLVPGAAGQDILG